MDYISIKQLLLFVFALMQVQTAVTANFVKGQLLLFAFGANMVRGSPINLKYFLK